MEVLSLGWHKVRVRKSCPPIGIVAQSSPRERFATDVTLVNRMPMPRHSRSPILRMLVLAFCLAATGCSRNDAGAVHKISYVLEWKRAAVAARPDGWEVTNDLGYRVGVTGGYLVTRSLELVPCNPMPPIALLREIGDFLAPHPAYAGHSMIADPSALKNADVESLLNPQSHSPATMYLGPQEYCQAHYLIARADPAATRLPTDADMVDKTLWLEGWFQRPADSRRVPFSVVTAVANGRSFNLPAGADGAVLNTGSVSAEIIVRRNLESIFDHVDFANMDAKRIGREVLANLIDDTEVELRVQDGRAGP
jgi:hypothetical protein